MPITKKLETNLDSAFENLQNGRIGNGTILLLEYVLLVKPLEEWPEDFPEKVTTAKEHFASGNFPKAVACVSKALYLIKESEKPKNHLRLVRSPPSQL